ncbi:hypothetical protein FB566_0819 [Stackebrandtia endophytica]|uniref:Uncharacterized protein n=1 Tax=Stackebrandtia endophytica TaxID=1496996 RepID=A0A543ARW4_9ACTN|nr:hypothetical protein FB566_0819 [Stackebrandtia endophytica]
MRHQCDGIGRQVEDALVERKSHPHAAGLGIRLLHRPDLYQPSRRVVTGANPIAFAVGQDPGTQFPQANRSRLHIDPAVLATGDHTGHQSIGVGEVEPQTRRWRGNLGPAVFGGGEPPPPWWNPYRTTAECESRQGVRDRVVSPVPGEHQPVHAGAFLAGQHRGTQSRDPFGGHGLRRDQPDPHMVGRWGSERHESSLTRNGRRRLGSGDRVATLCEATMSAPAQCIPDRRWRAAQR